MEYKCLKKYDCFRSNSFYQVIAYKYKQIKWSLDFNIQLILLRAENKNKTNYIRRLPTILY